MDVEAIRGLIAEQGSIRAVDRYFKAQGVDGYSERNIRRLLKNAITGDYEVEKIDVSIDVEELLERRRQEFQQKVLVENASKWHTIRMKSNDPIGFGIFGDPHIDDDGTDIGMLFDHAELFSGKQAGLYAVCLGDVWNNWVGRLQRLYADTSLNAAETRALVEHFMQRVHWVAFILGNHDLWNDKTDILEYMLSATSDVVAAHEQRVRIVFPNGKEVKILARHTFPGRSMWTPNFGAMKAAQLDGSCDIYTAGHIHVSGYTHGWHNGSERMWHAVQVASYKALDDYPKELGLAKRDIYQCPVALIDPNATSPVNKIRWEFDPHEGAKRLAWMRNRSS